MQAHTLVNRKLVDKIFNNHLSGTFAKARGCPPQARADDATYAPTALRRPVPSPSPRQVCQPTGNWQTTATTTLSGKQPPTGCCFPLSDFRLAARPLAGVSMVRTTMGFGFGRLALGP